MSLILMHRVKKRKKIFFTNMWSSPVRRFAAVCRVTNAKVLIFKHRWWCPARFLIYLFIFYFFFKVEFRLSTFCGADTRDFCEKVTYLKRADLSGCQAVDLADGRDTYDSGLWTMLGPRLYIIIDARRRPL